MLYPEIQTVKELLKEYRNVPTFYELLMDSYTPVHLFNALHERYENCFILESVDNKDQWSRYSYIGIEPKQRITLDKHKAYVEELSGEREITDVDDPISFFSGLIEKNKAPQFPNRPKLTGGMMGYFSYDVVRYFEKTLGNPPTDDLGLPDAELFNYDKLVAYDHLTNKAVIILNVNADDDADAKYAECERKAAEIEEVLRSYVPKQRTANTSPKELTITSNISHEQYLKNVETAKEYIRAGDIFQVVPSQRFEIQDPPNSFDVYRMLRSTSVRLPVPRVTLMAHWVLFTP